MKLAITSLILACSVFACGPVLFSGVSRIAGFDLLGPPNFKLDLWNIGFAVPDMGFFQPNGGAPACPPAPEGEPGPRQPVDTHALIRAAAKKHRVPAAFVKSIVAAESNFNCDAVSPKGAVGLMQLMPETAEEYGADPSIPEQNVDAGTHYLRVLMDKYSRHRNSLRRVIAAYNAGPGMVDRYHGVPPFRETRAYVVRVLSFLRHYERERG